MYTPPVTPWESGMPEVSGPTARRELPKAGLITGKEGAAEGRSDNWGEVVTR